MSGVAAAVTYPLPKVAHFDWSEFAYFDDEQNAQAVLMLREAKQYVEQLTLKQAVAEAAQRQDITDASVWAAYYALWGQIRDGNPHSSRQLFMVIDTWESDQGWTARAARELITEALDEYHTSRIDRAACQFKAWGVHFKQMVDPDDLHVRLGLQVAERTKSLADASLEAEHIQAGTD